MKNVIRKLQQLKQKEDNQKDDFKRRYYLRQRKEIEESIYYIIKELQVKQVNTKYLYYSNKYNLVVKYNYSNNLKEDIVNKQIQQIYRNIYKYDFERKSKVFSLFTQISEKITQYTVQTEVKDTNYFIDIKITDDTNDRNPIDYLYYNTSVNVDENEHNIKFSYYIDIIIKIIKKIIGKQDYQYLLKDDIEMFKSLLTILNNLYEFNETHKIISSVKEKINYLNTIIKDINMVKDNNLETEKKIEIITPLFFNAFNTLKLFSYSSTIDKMIFNKKMSKEYTLKQVNLIQKEYLMECLNEYC